MFQNRLNPLSKGLWVLLGLMCSAALVFGQEVRENQPDAENGRAMKITITETVDGETVEKVIEVPIDGAMRIDEVLEELEVDEEIDGMLEDEEMEIIIRKKEIDEELKEVQVEVTKEMDQLYEELERLRMELETEFGAESKRPLLGVHFEALSPETAESYGISGRKGAHVIEVVPGSGAANAGMEQGDVIIDVEGQPIRELEDLPKTIASYQAGDEIEVTYLRNGKKNKTLVTLGDRSPLHGMRIYRFNGDDIDIDMDFDEDIEFNWNGDVNEEVREEVRNSTFLGVVPGRSGEDGVKVEEVVPNSTAAKMNIAEGDVITGINGNPVRNLDELREELNRLDEGEAYSVEFTRDDVPLRGEGNAEFREKKVVIRKRFEGHPAHGHPGEGHRMEKRIEIRITVDEVTPEEAQKLAEANENFMQDNSLETSEFILYPNPNDGEFKLRIDLPDPGAVTFRVFNANGTQVFMEIIDSFEGGVFEREVDITDQAKGVYFLQISQNGKAQTRKIVTE